MEKIDSFSGQYRFLSNFFLCSVMYEGIEYPSSENAFQAAKTLDIDVRKIFALKEITPGISKRLGRSIVLRPHWDIIRLQTMVDILAAKFQDPVLAKLLIETGDAELIEGNAWNDTFWGVCNGKGTNFLGKALMDLRKKLTVPAA